MKQNSYLDDTFFMLLLWFLGRQFDKQGNLKQWWNNETIAEFRKAAQCIVDQYSNYTLDDVNLAIDGRLTQGENIADNGGLKQAYRVSTILIHPRAHRVPSIQFCFNIFCSWESC